MFPLLIAPTVVKRPNRARIWLGLSLVLGGWFWWTVFTDYSLAGSWPDVFLPPVLLALVALGWHGAAQVASRRRRRAARAALLTVFLGCGLQIALSLLIFVPPFTMGGMFIVSELLDEQRIQETVSPDGLFVAAVDYRGVGAYSGANGRIFVRVRPRWFPLIEREVWGGSTYQSVGDDFVKWSASHTLLVPDADAPIDVTSVRFRTPPPIQLVLGLAQMLERSNTQAQQDQSLTGPVQNVPLFPAPREEVALEYEPIMAPPGGMWRVFTIAGHNADDVGDWYKQALSQPPWSVVWWDRRSEDAQTVGSKGLEHLVYYCIQASRNEAGAPTRQYSWELLWGDQGPHEVRVIINTPPDFSFPCSKDHKP